MPNRVLRDWTNSERIDLLSNSAEIFFTRLIMKADDYGCFYGNTKLLKSHLYPLKDFSHTKILDWVKECEAIGIIQYYQVDGTNYIRINDFGQRTRIMRSKFPEPPKINELDDALSNDGQMTVNCQTDDGVKPNQTESETKPNPKPKKDSASAKTLDFDKLLVFINKTFGRDFKTISRSVRDKYNARIKEGYTSENIRDAMLNCKKSPHHIESNYKYCTPEFFSRSDKLDLYSSVNENLPKAVIPKSNYSYTG